MADELPQWSVAAETTEWVGPIAVTVDGVPTTVFEVSLTGPGVRPTEWVDPTIMGTDRGVLIGGDDFPLLPGRKYTVWVRYTDDPEAPVYRVGKVRTY